MKPLKLYANRLESPFVTPPKFIYKNTQDEAEVSVLNLYFLNAQNIKKIFENTQIFVIFGLILTL